ncbi:MAG: hypothetical protein KGI94_13350 [Paracoccaceae bacterium]|nr:hypothetical protein [Paracoccaceae bacterium]MDE3121767.1 hypothetical protein [Paracoccaceae bacterium]MDE3237949.1 hypothetical protein [Paracoccaceae bacterium]
MKKLIASTTIVLLAAGAAFADGYNNAPAAPAIGASIGGNSGGINNNATTVYQGASVSNSENAAVNSASSTQAGFLNTFVSAQAGQSAEVHAGDVSVEAPLLSATVGNGGTVNMSGMFQLMNTTNSIGN